ncbi:MAG: glucose-1-phosphate cytidylyltransferase [Gammaproteobacteria bacterium]
MKVVLLAGGFGTRLAEETGVRPKPMVEIGEQPILWHIMKAYAAYGFEDFVIALGYKGEFIKQYFLNFYASYRDLSIDLANGEIQYETSPTINWRIQMTDTGAATMTGGRLHRLESLLRPGGTFMLTYGDGVCDIDIHKLLDFHRKHGRVATVTAVRPPARFGTMHFQGDQVLEFKEKLQTGEGWINGGFFVFEPEVFDYLEGDETVLEGKPLETLAADGQLMAYKHEGFWQCMDTLRDKLRLQEMWASGSAPWKVW